MFETTLFWKQTPLKTIFLWLHLPCYILFYQTLTKVRSLQRPVPGEDGGGDSKRERGMGEAEGGNGGGDPLREAFNRLGSVIDFQARQQVIHIYAVSRTTSGYP